MRLKPTFLLFLLAFSIIGCSKNDSTNETENTKNLIGNKYAHLLFETREECEAAQESYMINCAQGLEIISDTEVRIFLTDILYNSNFYVKNNMLVVESTPDTYEFSEDLIFEIMDNGDLKLGEDNWIKYEEDFFE
ncbi:hypothetical protein [Christiangramia salexigens]|uniref:Lipoprotein n=1 Tax=Christiangramia salexigens TaxID=1913577 RepID=A0A1L3J3Y8_9FLAO|nr:hypothetical protein [Christiangramia salexigens]APG59859.1 hypothetical protein LPB144_05270 [Christiangramia salexigens]